MGPVNGRTIVIEEQKISAIRGEIPEDATIIDILGANLSTKPYQRPSLG
jgi:hypothetical protein